MKSRSLVALHLLALGLGLLPGLNACSSDGVADLDDEWPDGALIGVRLESRVGVLLDELPAELRDRAATQLAGESSSFWQARARAQIQLSSYRLVFRNFYYDEEEGRGQLPLPPTELWQIELSDDIERETIDGHDVVARGYTLTSTLLTDEVSAGAADPEFEEIGGVWEEPFTFPIDPELLLQRTGYACMDESEFPPNSVDGENAAT